MTHVGNMSALAKATLLRHLKERVGGDELNLERHGKVLGRLRRVDMLRYPMEQTRCLNGEVQRLSADEDEICGTISNCVMDIPYVYFSCVSVRHIPIAQRVPRLPDWLVPAQKWPNRVSSMPSEQNDAIYRISTRQRMCLSDNIDSHAPLVNKCPYWTYATLHLIQAGCTVQRIVIM